MMMVMVIMIKEIADADAVAVSPVRGRSLRRSLRSFRTPKMSFCGRREMIYATHEAANAEDARMLRYTIAMKCLKQRETTSAEQAANDPGTETNPCSSLRLG